MFVALRGGAIALQGYLNFSIAGWFPPLEGIDNLTPWALAA